MEQQSNSPNFSNKVLFWASFFTLVAAGIGFSVRGVGLLRTWGELYGFTQAELGTITGGGLLGFGIAIIALGAIADKIGYGRLMILAFLLHLSSGIVTLCAGFVYAQYGKEACFMCLLVGMWLFSLGNGTCEAVINPLTATLFPNNKTHWLNILHAGWPAGLILGALIDLGFGEFAPKGTSWQLKFSIFFVPVVMYGLMMLGRKFPTSETSASGVSFGSMFATLFHPILLFLFVIHAMVGYVELGTDSWISNITGTILANQSYGTILFVWTSLVMFGLRFFAGPIVHRISPLGLLFASAVIAAGGLYFLGSIDAKAGTTAIIMAFIAATIYGLGKTFFWPTMLGVISERFPKGGALALGTAGGLGMLSAGMLGGPAIGFKQDYYATKHIEPKAPETYARYKVAEAKSFKVEFFSLELYEVTFVPKVAGLDNGKLGVLKDKAAVLKSDLGKINTDRARAALALELSAEINVLLSKYPDDASGLGAVKAANDAVTASAATLNEKAKALAAKDLTDDAKTKLGEEWTAAWKTFQEKGAAIGKALEAVKFDTLKLRDDKADEKSTKETAKMGTELATTYKDAVESWAKPTEDNKKIEKLESNLVGQADWWRDSGLKLVDVKEGDGPAKKVTLADQDGEPIKEASLYGGQQALIVTAIVPATMAICYLLLILVFKLMGGYKQEHIGGQSH